MDTIIDIDLFDNDERLVINSAFEGMSLSEFTRQRLLENIRFGINISEDSLCLNLLEGLQSKVSKLSDEEWSRLSLKLPFFALYDENSGELPDE